MGFLYGVQVFLCSWLSIPCCVFSWIVCRGFRQASGFGIGSGVYFCSVDSLSCKSAYLFVLSELVTSPHCVEKFFPLFGSLYWSATWCQLFFFDLDHTIIELSWKLAHRVLYTAEQFSFGYDVPSSCFCCAPCQSLRHFFFFNVLLLLVFFCGFNLSCFACRHCLLQSWFITFCLVFLVMSFVPSLMILCLLNVCKLAFDGFAMTIISTVFLCLLSMSWIMSRLIFTSISNCFVFISLSVSGMLVITLLQSFMALSSFTSSFHVWHNSSSRWNSRLTGMVCHMLWILLFVFSCPVLLVPLCFSVCHLHLMS